MTNRKWLNKPQPIKQIHFHPSVSSSNLSEHSSLWAFCLRLLRIRDLIDWTLLLGHFYRGIKLMTVTVIGNTFCSVRSESDLMSYFSKNHFILMSIETGIFSCLSCLCLPVGEQLLDSMEEENEWLETKQEASGSLRNDLLFYISMSEWHSATKAYLLCVDKTVGHNIMH